MKSSKLSLSSPTIVFDETPHTGLYSTGNTIVFLDAGVPHPVLTIRPDGTIDVHGDPERAIQAFADMVRGQHRH